MLESGWQEEFRKLAPGCIGWLSEQVELAYKQGSTTRLKSLVDFLLKHNVCDDSFLVYLAEAGLKTNRPILAEFALTELLKRYPEEVDYLLHLSDVLSAQSRFKEALALFSELPADLQFQQSVVQTQSQVSQRLAQQNELNGVIKDILQGDVGKGLSDEEFYSNADSLLQLALNTGDHLAVIETCVTLAARIDLQDEFLIQLCDKLNLQETQRYMALFVERVCAQKSYPNLVRFYLEWMTNHSKPVDNASILIKYLKPVRSKNEYADVFAILYFLNSDWDEFGKVCDRAMNGLTKPPVLFRMSAIYWHSTKQLGQLSECVEKAAHYNAKELWFLASGLEVSDEYIDTRLKLLQSAHRKNQDDADLLNDLGNALQRKGDFAGACQYFYKATIKDEAEKFHTHFNLASMLQNQGDNKKALDYYKLALAINPERDETWKSLVSFMLSSKLYLAAYDFARYYLAHHEKDYVVWCHLAGAARGLSRLAEAREYITQSLEIEPAYTDAISDLGLTEIACGNIPEAMACYKSVLTSSRASDVSRRTALSNLLFCGNYNPDLSAEQLYHIYQAVTGHMPRQKYFPEVADYKGRRIRIGYVSADFKKHPVAFFIEKLFEFHDKSKFEIYAYSCVSMEDHYSELLKNHVEHWKYVAKTSDADLAEQIIEDGIDILVDLSGHTDGSRLGVFALKPCAVQMSWLGFAQTTGLRQMDYFLGDHQLTPEDHDQYFSEKPYRLPRASYCFAPNVHYQDFQPEVKRRPDNEPLVFGNLGRAIRFNTPVLNLWKRVLDAVPNSIIKIDNPNFFDEESQQMMRQRFAEHGIPSERLWVGYTKDYFQSIVDIDIALDGFPQNSGTTLFEFLWCGTPVVTLKDRPSVGRLGAMVLHGVGRDEWVAETPEQYVEIIKHLASDRDELFRMRSGLRQEFLDSELCDGPDFARAVEGAYVAMLEEKSLCQ